VPIKNLYSVSDNNLVGLENNALALPKGRNSVNRRKKRVVKEQKIIVCKVEFDGELKPNKPLYFPEFDHLQEFDMSIVTTKDVKDIHSSMKIGVDFISVSYVQSKEDIMEVRELLSVKGRHIKIIAKIQNKKALANFDEIAEVSDGIIIARGYLGLDLKLEDVAYIQRYLITKCNFLGKPVILSTQIMESMVTRLRPTRAEVSDISNAVSDLIWLNGWLL
jgi:pyruvate kinase